MRLGIFYRNIKLNILTHFDRNCPLLLPLYNPFTTPFSLLIASLYFLCSLSLSLSKVYVSPRLSLMAETPLKRQREETHVEEEDSKRHKSYNHILSILDADEEEPTQDLSSLITTLQQELSSDSSFDPVQCPASEGDAENSITASATLECTSSSSSSSTLVLLKEGEEEDKEGFIRHLLEASDDELGIPNREVRVDDGEYGFHDGDLFCLGNVLWELEDEAANFYTLLQSELFM